MGDIIKIPLISSEITGLWNWILTWVILWWFVYINIVLTMFKYDLNRQDIGYYDWEVY